MRRRRRMETGSKSSPFRFPRSLSGTNCNFAITATGLVRWSSSIDGMTWKTSVTGFAICGTAIRSSSAKPKKFLYSFHGGRKVAASARIAVKFKKWVENVESNEPLFVGGEA